MGVVPCGCPRDGTGETIFMPHNDQEDSLDRVNINFMFEKTSLNELT
jgi:hypothetical protein